MGTLLGVSTMCTRRSLRSVIPNFEKMSFLGNVSSLLDFQARERWAVAGSLACLRPGERSDLLSLKYAQLALRSDQIVFGDAEVIGPKERVGGVFG
jgi:hypothetical protein